MYAWGYAAPSEPEPAPPADEDPEFSDRLAAFIDLGFDELAAFALAWSNVSRSYVRELLNHGCGHDLAVQIML